MDDYTEVIGTTPGKEDDYKDVIGRAVSGTTAEVELRRDAYTDVGSRVPTVGALGDAGRLHGCRWYDPKDGGGRATLGAKAEKLRLEQAVEQLPNGDRDFAGN